MLNQQKGKCTNWVILICFESCVYSLSCLGKAHLREALLIHEEAVAVLKTSLKIKSKDVFLSIIQRSLQKCIQNYEDVDQEDDFQVKQIISYFFYI